MIAIVDYGVGNLYSLCCSLGHIGEDACVTRDESTLRLADGIILPGVGAFGDAANKLRGLGLDGLLCELAVQGKPLMGICLGMQLLFERSFEYGEHAGLGLIAGEVRPLEPVLGGGAKTPHMGWNTLEIKKSDRLLYGISDGDAVYYVHSYYAVNCDNAVLAASEHGGVSIPGLVRSGSVCGAQFHPEKSGEVGLRILKSFARGCAEC